MELWDIRDAQGNLTGRLHERGKPLEEGDYHLIIDAWIQNSRGEFLITRRAPWKEPYAGKWEPTCGCAIAGDNGFSAVLREVREEVGLTLDLNDIRLLSRIVNHRHQYILEVFITHKDVFAATTADQVIYPHCEP